MTNLKKRSLSPLPPKKEHWNVSNIYNGKKNGEKLKQGLDINAYAQQDGRRGSPSPQPATEHW